MARWDMKSRPGGIQTSENMGSRKLVRGRVAAVGHAPSARPPVDETPPPPAWRAQGGLVQVVESAFVLAKRIRAGNLLAIGERERMTEAYIGVDVGTAERPGRRFRFRGAALAAPGDRSPSGARPGEIVEQSSDDIWRAVTARGARGGRGVRGCQPGAVRGMGFDATCSLVALDERAGPCRSVRPMRRNAT